MLFCATCSPLRSPCAALRRGQQAGFTPLLPFPSLVSSKFTLSDWAITVCLKTWHVPFLPWVCLSLLLLADVPPCLKLGFLEAEQEFGGMWCPGGGSGEKGRGVMKQVGKGIHWWMRSWLGCYGTWPDHRVSSPWYIGATISTTFQWVLGCPR